MKKGYPVRIGPLLGLVISVAIFLAVVFTYITKDDPVQAAGPFAPTMGGFVTTANLPLTQSQASAGSGTCQSLKIGPEILWQVLYNNNGAQTGTLTIYNEGAAPACNAGDVIYTSATHASASVPDVLNFYEGQTGAGIAYKWTTAGEAGLVFIGTTP